MNKLHEIGVFLHIFGIDVVKLKTNSRNIKKIQLQNI